jgi:hypothetical protein
MKFRNSRQSLHDLASSGALWLRAWLAVIILLATAGLLERLS